MRNYRVSVMADRYPTEYLVAGSTVAVAVAKAMRLWRKRFRGSKSDEWTIRVVKGAEVRDPAAQVLTEKDPA